MPPVVAVQRIPSRSIVRPKPRCKSTTVRSPSGMRRFPASIRGCSCEDCGSTNGTFVNGKRLSGRDEIRVGDLLQFANFVYRLGRHEARPHDGTMEESVLPWAQTLLQFERLMSDKAVSPHFQPIVRLADSHVVGFELLARSTLEGLTSPADMFATANMLGQECSLSELMREVGVRKGLRLTDNPLLFVNTHPKEIVTADLVRSLYEIRAIAERMPLVIEIHEAAITEKRQMQQLREGADRT